MAYEERLARMMARVSDNYDKRAPGTVHDTLAPAAYELELLQSELEQQRDLAIIAASSGSYLDDLIAPFGVYRLTASHAVRRGVFEGAEPPEGSRWGLDGLVYTVGEPLAAGQYAMTCEQTGIQGNAPLGNLLPVEPVKGVTSARLTEIIIPARDGETDEAFRERFYSEMADRPQEGNAAQYYQWAANFDTIGSCRVIPLWDGPCTVKVSILDGDNNPASATLIRRFQDFLDPDSEGLGNGAAPIGARVTVSTAGTLAINIAAGIGLARGYDAIGEEVAASLADWFRETAYRKSRINYMEIGAVILSCVSVDSVHNMTVNGGTGDIVLSDEVVAELGALALEVIP